LSFLFSSASAHRLRIDMSITSSGVAPDAAAARSRFALARFGTFGFLPAPALLPPRIFDTFSKNHAAP
jgi:hypothetical protein